MPEILDSATIKIDLKMKGNYLAQVILNWQNVFEVRFFRITLRGDGSLWFQFPALKEHNWAKCFAIIDHSNWAEMEKKVSDSFMKELKKAIEVGDYPPEIINKIKDYQAKEEVNLSEIPF